jgi:cytochrome b subunit of formate dehydrogenase
MTVSQMDGAIAASAPVEKVERHRLADRLYHWVMALAVLILMGTAFLPKVGIKFPWLSIHWVTGILLTALVLIHIVRALFFQDFWSMMIGGRDIGNTWRAFRGVFSRSVHPGKPGKYNTAQKLYHWGIALILLAIIASGLTMLLKIDTGFWKRDPYILPDDSWGIIYAVHGLAAMGAITMVMVHIYFAVRPDEWYLTRSMFRGWISRKEYQDHFDRSRWTPPSTDA